MALPTGARLTTKVREYSGALQSAATTFTMELLDPGMVCDFVGIQLGKSDVAKGYFAAIVLVGVEFCWSHKGASCFTIRVNLEPFSSWSGCLDGQGMQFANR